MISRSAPTVRTARLDPGVDAPTGDPGAAPSAGGSGGGAAGSPSGPAAPAAGGGGTGAAAPNQASDVGVTESVIRIGNITAENGVLGDTFAPAVRGLRAWVQHTNATGGIRGRKVELFTCDDREDRARSLECARRLVEQDKVFALVATNTRSLGGASQYLADQDVPVIGLPINNAFYRYPEFFTVYGAGYARDGKTVGVDGNLVSTSGQYRWFKQNLKVSKAAVFNYDISESSQAGDTMVEGVGGRGLHGGAVHGLVRGTELRPGGGRHAEEGHRAGLRRDGRRRQPPVVRCHGPTGLHPQGEGLHRRDHGRGHQVELLAGVPERDLRPQRVTAVHLPGSRGGRVPQRVRPLPARPSPAPVGTRGLGHGQHDPGRHHRDGPGTDPQGIHRVPEHHGAQHRRRHHGRHASSARARTTIRRRPPRTASRSPAGRTTRAAGSRPATRSRSATPTPRTSPRRSRSKATDDHHLP